VPRSSKKLLRREPNPPFTFAASYANRILKSAKPSELPVQTPINFDLVVNLKTAKVLGLYVPSSIRLRADKVIE
jgi:putative ABC transport system substrate-binding protein